MRVKTFFGKKVPIIWLIIVIVFFVICFLEGVIGFNNFRDYIVEGHRSCAEYCADKNQPLYLHDVIRQACQCYDAEERPTDYKNLNSGVEIEYIGNTGG